MSKKKLPYWMKRRISCPSCGFIFHELDIKYNAEYYNCPRCKERFDQEEFWEENSDKYSKTIREENFS